VLAAALAETPRAGPGAGQLDPNRWAAKMERLAINERIAAARERVESEGGKWGRPRRLDAASERRVFQMHKEDRSLREIAVALKIPRATVGRTVARLAKAAQAQETA